MPSLSDPLYSLASCRKERTRVLAWVMGMFRAGGEVTVQYRDTGHWLVTTKMP